MTEEPLVDVHRELFNKSYLVYVPYSATVPKQELKEYGVVGFHTKESLARYLSDPILVHATPVQIATMMSNGDSVSLHNAEDAATMYDALVQHLENWMLVGQQHLVSRLPPLSDLIALDELAGALYPHIVVNDSGPSTTMVDYALGDDLLLGLMTLETPEAQKGYQPYTPIFIEMGTPDH